MLIWFLKSQLWVLEMKIKYQGKNLEDKINFRLLIDRVKELLNHYWGIHPWIFILPRFLPWTSFWPSHFSCSIEKNLSLSSCVSPILSHYYHSQTSDTRCLGVFPNSKQLCDTNSVSYNLTQFWDYLRRDTKSDCTG